MITKTKAYTSSDGAVHATLEAAQEAELVKLLDSSTGQTWDAATLALVLIDRRAEVLNILTTCKTSHPRARNINGAKRKPRVKAASLAQVNNGIDAMRAAVGSPD